MVSCFYFDFKNSIKSPNSRIKSKAMRPGYKKTRIRKEPLLFYISAVLQTDVVFHAVNSNQLHEAYLMV